MGSTVTLQSFFCAKKTKIMTLFNKSPPYNPCAILKSITYVINALICAQTTYPHIYVLTMSLLRFWTLVLLGSLLSMGG